MNIRRLLHILTAISITLALTISMPAKIVTAELGPIAVVFIEDNHVVGFHWPVGTLLTLTIDDLDTPAPVDYTDTETVLADPDPSVPESTAARFWPGDAFRIEPGHVVTLSGGGTTKIHTVTSLTRDGVDMPGDKLWGSADPDSVVEVRNRWQRNVVRWETVDSTGYWQADFSVAGDSTPEEDLTHDFSLGTYFMIMQNDDDGDHTQVNFEMPFPTMQVQLTQNAMSWRDWPSGYPVDILFDDPDTPANPDYSITVDPETPHPEAPNCGCLLLEGAYSLRPGHIVKMTNGFLTKTQTVSGLQVTDFDYLLDAISGTVEPNSEVSVETQFNIRRRVMADGVGNWIADFSIAGDQEDEQDTSDLIQWDEGTARVSDDDQDTTEVTWPIELNLNVGDEIRATNWYAGDEVTLTIDNPATPTEVDFTASAYPMVGPWAYTGIDFDIGQTFRTQPGYIVNLSQIDHNKTCVVSPIQVTGVDYIKDLVTGTSNPYDLVQVYAPLGGGDEWARYRYNQADANGQWQVDFSQPGTHIIRHPKEIDVVDIFPGQSISATVGDDNACFTSVWTRVAIPVIRVRLTAGEIYAQNYPPGYPVTINVFQPGDLVNPVYSDTQVMGADNLINFDYPDTLNISAGYLVRATDDVVSKEHIVTQVWIDDVDRDLDQVYGVAATGTLVTVVARSATVRAQRDLTAGPGGAWTADFSRPGAEPWEQDTIDLDTAYIVFAYQADDDNDMTWVHWLFNQPPVVGDINLAAAPVPVNTLVQVSASFSDPDVGDSHTAVWDWGDGSTSDGVVDEATRIVTGSHTYSEASVYTLKLTLCDAAGECNEALYQYLVVYDPAGGFVTGGGWITSPPGAYTPDPALTGKATFGFVSKYQKGKSVPSGNTEFQFKTADFNFSSTAFGWMVIAGAKAQYKGVGTINGSGEYGFILTATDGQINGGGGVDKFRIKIWDIATGNIIFDNQMGTGDTAVPITALGGGSIEIHTR
jgi:hypothetical protein